MSIKGNSANPSMAGKNLARRSTHHHYISGGLATIALGLFVAAAALAVVKPSSHIDPPAFTQTRTTLPLPAPFPEASLKYSSPFIDETRIRPGDTVSALLQRLDVDEEGLLSFLTHDKSARSIYKLYPGRVVQAALNEEGQLVWLRYYHTPAATQDGTSMSRWLEVRPDGNGGFQASEEAEQAQTHVRVAEGEITSSLFGATDAAGIPDAITLQMAEILGSKIDFMRDLRQGDRFRIIYEAHHAQGRDVGSGRILALQFVNGNKTHDAVWFKPSDGSGGYYDFEGQSMRGAFLRSALKFSRVSSTFGKRRHPIHGTYRNHNGVDYAAPTGTPIHATADGTVAFIGTQRGYGKTIILQHHGKYSTLYAHQSRFAKGLKKGSKVEQGQLIGYVGSTGWATGPHLHYEFRIGNRHVDPLSVDLPVARSLEGKDRQAFQAVVAEHKQQIAMLAALQEGHVQLASR
ncbi:M23 family metallopeptidase [Pusillimonas sp. (ex Stolz et al. 2005)]|uniref:M23 family metallopeptidase n=1 Tax=Pusillimonas sp. (ex Stolz et al. 2005) TaxID=1979962 RepID=UPI0026353E8C|nr:M23 family metallopeptidase [Pusillimonas sp. (ex Stolz et al. 2005)]